METRANHVWVGAITLLLLAGLAVFFVWLARLGNTDRKEYDIFFTQSVGGLANGSQVTFSGVPAGQVTDIDLWRQDPEFVRVRVSIDEDVPILQGTVASISASFTGVSNVTLDGAVRGALPITEIGPEGVPVIPTRPGALGEILSSAPLLLERLATLTERLTRVLDDDNQESIQGILANTNAISGELANTAPELRGTLRELQNTLAEGAQTLDEFERTLVSTNNLINNEGAGLANELRTTLQAAQSVTDDLELTLQGVQPITRQISETTLPAANATLRDLRRTSESLRTITEQIENQGASSLLGGRPLPTYQPD
jgi:phospholipid/cholesterol/gamma-HCH transport system substrate-binding protein